LCIAQGYDLSNCQVMLGTNQCFSEWGELYIDLVHNSNIHRMHSLKAQWSSLLTSEDSQTLLQPCGPLIYSAEYIKKMFPVIHVGKHFLCCAAQNLE